MMYLLCVWLGVFIGIFIAALLTAASLGDRRE